MDTKRIMLRKGIVTVALLGAASTVAEPVFGQGLTLEYSEDFAAAPGWTTDQPANYFWDSGAQEYHAATSNAEPCYTPSRYSYTLVEYDGNSLRLELDFQPVDLQWSAGVAFGLFDSNLMIYGALPPATPDAHYLHMHPGRGDLGRTIGFYARGANGVARQQNIGWNLIADGTWYRCVIEYDSATDTATFTITRRDNGAPVDSVQLTGLGGFPADLDYLGFARDPAGECCCGGSCPGYSCSNQATAYVDNINFSEAGGTAQCDDFGDRLLVLERWAENHWVGAPTVIRDGGEYRMWLRSDLGNGSAGIFSTTSLDGITWAGVQPVLHPGPASWDRVHLYEGVVIKEGSVYKMWYTGYGGANNQIGYATSSDGVNWTKHVGNPVVTLGAWDSRVVRVGSVIFDDVEGLYKMWYTGGSGWFHPLQVGYATSPDGITWTKHPGPVFTFGSTTEWIRNHANVILLDGVYEMYFSSETGDLRKATSVNGIDWTVSGCSPVLEPPASGWDSGRVGAAHVLAEEGVLKLWYGGSDGIQSGIGFAQSGAPPSCDGGGPYVGECEGQWTSILLDGSGSSDPDGDALAYGWETDCPGGLFDDPASAMPVLTVDTSTGCAVACGVTLVVDDGNGGTAECATTVSISDTQPPVVLCSATPFDGHRLMIEYSAEDACGDVSGAAVIETACCPLPVVSGQVVKVECEDEDECELKLDFEDDVFEIKANMAALVVTATDECGNEATCIVDLCISDDDDGDSDSDDHSDSDDDED